MKSRFLHFGNFRTPFIPAIMVLLLMVVNLTLQAQSCIPKPSGLIHWWDGDAVNGTTAVDLVGGSNGDMLNGLTTAPGMVGNAFSFDGNDDYLSTPVYLDYSNGITFEIWVKTNDVAGVIMGDGGGATLERGMYIGIESGGNVWLLSTKTDGDNFKIVRAASISDGNFHHIVGAWTGTTENNGASLYIDGNLVGSTNALTTFGQLVSAEDYPVCLGGHNFISANSSYRFFGGLIDEAKIYNRALTAEEVAAIFNAGASGICKTDGCGDEINPTASNPAPLTVQCIDDVPAPDIAVVTDAADNSGTPVVAFVSDVSNGESCPEVITRTYSVTDACLNQILVTQTITVADDIKPTASNPAPVTVKSISDIPVADITVVTDEADNCGMPAVAFVSDVSNGGTSPEIITRT